MESCKSDLQNVVLSQMYKMLFVSQIYKLLLYVSQIYKMSLVSQICKMLFLSKIYKMFGLRLDFLRLDIFSSKEINVSVYVISCLSKCTKTYEHVATLKST